MKILVTILTLMLFVVKSIGQISLANSKRLNNILYNVFDKSTGQMYSFSKITQFTDSTKMDRSKCDGIVYIEYQNEYFKRNYGGAVNLKWFGCNETINNNQIIINRILSKYKTAYLPEGVYKFSETIFFPANSAFSGLGKNTVLKYISSKPADAVSVFRGSYLKGFMLDCTATDMDSSAGIMVNPWYTVASELGELKIQDVIIKGKYPQLQGVALKLAIFAGSSSSMVSVINFCKFFDIDIYGFRDGITCLVDYKKGNNVSYINANIFNNIIIHKCLRPLRLINNAEEIDVNSGKASISSNHFENLIIQHVVGNYPAIELEGCFYNKIDAQIIDWPTNYFQKANKSKFNDIITLPADIKK